MRKKLSIIALCNILILSLFGCDKLSSANKKPEWSKNAVIYEVNVRQYTPEGTFNAFKKELPRLKGLGVDTLWFMPIYPISQKNRIGTLGSYYSVKDYKDVNPEFGNMDDFKALVKEAHNMGFKVIIDWVANHTGWDNEWIKNKDWYTKGVNGEIISPLGTGWNDVADLNYDNKDMRKAMIDAMKFWVEKVDVDGFRCDYAEGVPKDFWEDARASLNKIKPVFMLAEDNKNYNFLEKAFNCNYGWDLYNSMIKIAAGSENAPSITKCYDKIEMMYPKGGYTLNFTSNHDENSWNGTEYERFKGGVKTMGMLTFTLPGIPLIYSGQEAGFNRRLKFFGKECIDWQTSPVTDFYKDMIKLKKENEALWNGGYGGDVKFLSSSDSNILAFGRKKGKDSVVVIANLSSKKVSGTVGADKYEGEYITYLTNSKYTFSEKQNVELEPWQYIILVKK